jgi:hypothetical protein
MEIFFIIYLLAVLTLPLVAVGVLAMIVTSIVELIVEKK